LREKEFKNIDEVRAQLKPQTHKGSGEWVDLSGLIAPKNATEELLNSIEQNTLTLDEIQKSLNNIHKEYYNYEWTWAKEKLEERWGKSINEVTYEDIISMVETWKESVVKLDKLIYDDAKKEFNLNSKTGFGVDGDEARKDQDFESVRGSFENNPFVLEVLNHIKKKTDLGNELIERLKKPLTI
jgi:benzoyl-CoA reductase/2-hydroxyglutaryl-CoA dehydratase subunit BcrC/BadD/HgdB